MTTFIRREQDSLGAIAVSTDVLWGAHTQRALLHFQIGSELMPLPAVYAMARIKRAAAMVNAELTLLDNRLALAIAQAAGEVLQGIHDQQFPLHIWQSGSGTQSHMNMNEVLANRASEILGADCGDRRIVHPNDHVNLGQSSNDVFPTAMHLCVLDMLHAQLLPALQQLIDALQQKQQCYSKLVKLGRTHLQDAVPLTLGQEISAWVAQLQQVQRSLGRQLPDLYPLAIGGTAVGTGLNCHPDFAHAVIVRLAEETGLPLSASSNRFAIQAAHDDLLACHGLLKVLAAVLNKMANDIRWLASGPRAGLGELLLPENEAGSSIMPGKVNPTQCEAITMLCCQVMGNDVTIALACASGQLQLNTYKPLILLNLLQSLSLLADGMRSFKRYCITGLAANEAHIQASVAHSLMLVTALVPHIGYDRAAVIAQYAQQQDCSLREAAIAVGGISDTQFSGWVDASAMV